MSWRLTHPSTLVYCNFLRNNAIDEITKTEGTWTGESYIENPWGYSAGDFDGTDDNVAVGNVYNGIKSVSFLATAGSTTEQFLELADGIDVIVSGGTVTPTGWTSPTVYIGEALTTTLAANVWKQIVVTSATGINANAVNLGKSGSDYGDISLCNVKFFNCELTWDEALVLNRMSKRGM